MQSNTQGFNDGRFAAESLDGERVLENGDTNHTQTLVPDVQYSANLLADLKKEKLGKIRLSILKMETIYLDETLGTRPELDGLVKMLVRAGLFSLPNVKYACDEALEKHG